MHTINIHNLIKLEISDDIARLAVKQIKRFNTGPFNKSASDHDLFTLKISKRHTPTPPKTLGVDLAFKVGDDYLEGKCSYKFSNWRYALTCHHENCWEFEISGDVFSSLAWPFRTLGPLIRLILLKRGCYFFHSAGFFNGKNAVMLMAPSGTGKTLTSLHWLCEGGKIYSDDTVMIRKNKLIPTIRRLSFWEYRYRNTPEVLPANMPAFSELDQKKMKKYQLAQKLTGGYVGLGLGLDVELYWPGCRAPEAPPKRIIALQKGRGFSVATPEEDELKIFFNRLMGDLAFQNIMIMRLADAATLTGKLQFLGAREFFKSYSNMLSTLFQDCEVLKVTVPMRYSRENFEQLKALIYK
ncbi:MAG: hypothetical protein PHR12_07040 [Victivallaceae bacterium]|nr:hypothetical protein [Victivallaceae bacterium]